MSDFERFVLELEPAKLAKAAVFLPREAVRVLQLFDGTRRLADVVEKSPLDVFKTLAVVKRGAELGLLSLGEKCSPSNPARSLSPETRKWLQKCPDSICGRNPDKSFGSMKHSEGFSAKKEAQKNALHDEEEELERELDRVLSELDENCAREEGLAPPVLLESLPHSLEQNLQNALDEYLDKTATAGPIEILSADDEELIEMEDTGFTEMEAAFFDSYELDDEEDDECENLWVLGDETGSTPTPATLP